MRFGTYHVFQCPPWTDPATVVRQELERVELSEQLGFDEVWVPEQHFSPYCLCGDALWMLGHIAGRTRRVRLGTAVVNITFTHPLRFLERVALLDRASGGRADVGIGRGYQFPQYGVFGVPIDETRAIFEETLDVVLGAWGGEDFSYQGRYLQIPNMRVWPVPERPPEKLLLHAVGSAESLQRAVERGIPAIMARPLTPHADQMAELRQYRAALEKADVDPAPVLERLVVLKYAFVAPTRAEAHALPRQAFEWDMGILRHLTTPTTTEMPKGYDMYARRAEAIPQLQYEKWVRNVLLFDEPEAIVDRVHELKEAGVQRLLLWMAPGGVAHELLVQSMRLFAERVAPRFR